jgi:hypothetical protein
MLYILEPEVAGGFGENVVYDPSTRHVEHLHYQFDGWLGDDLLTTTPCYIVTDRLRSVIEQSARTGYEFETVEVTTSELFRELYPDRELPKFWWLKVTGKPGVDDFGLSPDYYGLVVRDSVLTKMKERAQLDNCDISDFE